MTWPVAFALTQVLEVPIHLLALRGTPLSTAWRVAVAFGASALTHPTVWFLGPPLVRRLGWWGHFGVVEAFAVAAEAGFLWSFEVRRPLAWSLLANGTSATVGVLLSLLG